MAKIKLVMDSRRADKDGRYPIRISISKNRSTVYVGTGVSLSKREWDGKKCVLTPLKETINKVLRKKLLETENADMEAQLRSGYASLSASDIKAMVVPHEDEPAEGNFEKYYLKVCETKSETTRGVYMQTHSRLRAYLGDKLKDLSFEDITVAWLTDFDVFMSNTAPSANARSIHMRNIRSVFNSAIDDELTESYPFRKFKIKRSPTAKRSLRVEDLRRLFDFPCEEYQRRHIDMFKLMFMLRGINMADLSHLKEIEGGRICYERAKTHKPYSVKVEPEALTLIDKYKGSEWLLDIMDRYGRHQDYTKRANRSLQAIGELKRLPGRGGKKSITPAFPGLTLYWARHTWATIAATLDIPKEVIAAGLGHGSDTVTDIYIDFDQGKVDRANRMILDWVLYKKKKIWRG